MKLSTAQLAEVKRFIQSRGIKYIDVQTEILDHVASAIEEKMDGNALLTFEDALKQTHASFGIFGFGSMEDAIIKGMNSRFRKIFWKNFSALLGLKYIALVLLSGLFVYKAQVLINDYDHLLTIFLMAILGLLGILVVFSLNHKGYKNFLTYRTSSSYLIFIGSFLNLFNFGISKAIAGTIWGANSNYLIGTVILVFFGIYVIAAFRTAIMGIRESKLLMEKYQLLAY